MSIEIKCEWCGRHIADVTYQKVREYVQKHGEVCGGCQKRVTLIEEFFEKKRERFMQKFNRLLDDAKEKLAEEIKRLANVRNSD